MSAPALGAVGRPAVSRARLAGVGGRVAVGVALFFALVVFPTTKYTYADYAAAACVFILVGLSMNVLLGYTGQLSLGQQGFVGFGALVGANVAHTGNTAADPLSFAVSLLGSMAASAALAVILGLIALRITGLYLALVTLVFGSTVGDSLLGIASLNGHDAGVSAVRPTFLMSNGRYFLFCALLVVVVFALDVRLLASKAGRALLALKENERAAGAFGINVVSYKLLAFAISGGIAGLAGGLDAFRGQEFSQKNYTDINGFNLAVTFVVIVVVGGLGNRLGAAAAAAFFGLLPLILNSAFSLLNAKNYYTDHKGYLPGLIGAVLLLQTVIANPGGLGQVLTPLARWLRGGPFRGSHGETAREVIADVRA